MLTLNLLPKTAKDQIRFEKSKRFIVFAGVSVFLSITLFGALLFSTKLYIDIQADPLIKDVEEAQTKYETQKAMELEKDIKLLRARIVQVGNIQSDSVDWLSFFTEFSRLPLEGVTIKSISIGVDNNKDTKQEFIGLRKVILAGHATSRDQGLLVFEDAIQESPDFENLVSPSTNYTRDRDIDFTLTFYIIENK